MNEYDHFKLKIVTSINKYKWEYYYLSELYDIYVVVHVKLRKF